MNLLILICVFSLSISPLFLPRWRWFLIACILFVLAEAILVVSIDNELSDPNLDDSVGTAFVGIIPLAFATIFVFCVVLKLGIFYFRAVKRKVTVKKDV